MKEIAWQHLVIKRQTRVIKQATIGFAIPLQNKRFPQVNGIADPPQSTASDGPPVIFRLAGCGSIGGVGHGTAGLEAVSDDNRPVGIAPSYRWSANPPDI